jgi:hypothetical protein
MAIQHMKFKSLWALPIASDSQIITPNASPCGWLFHALSIEMADIPAAVG